MATRKIRSISDLLTARNINIADQWLLEPLKTYLRTLSVYPTNSDVFGLFEYVEPHSSTYEHRPRQYRRSASFNTERFFTCRDFESAQEVFENMHILLMQGIDNEMFLDFFSIVEQDGKITELRRDHEALATSRTRTMRFTSGAINLRTFDNYESYINAVEEVKRTKNRQFKTTLEQRSKFKLITLPGSFVFNIGSQKKKNGELSKLEEIFESLEADAPLMDDSEKVAYFESGKSGSRYWNTIERLFDLFYTHELTFSNTFNIEEAKLLNAYRTLVSAAENAKSLVEVEDALTTVLSSIDNYSLDRNLEESIEVRWDLFGEALLEIYCGNPEPGRTQQLLFNCINSTFPPKSFNRQMGWEILRRLHWHDNSWQTAGLITQADINVKQHRLSAKEIVKQCNNGSLIFTDVIESLLHQMTSPQDRHDSLWHAVDIALKAKDTYPIGCKMINDFLVKVTNSKKVSGQTLYPNENEWYRRICGGDNERPRTRTHRFFAKDLRSIDRVFKKGASKLAQITAVARSQELKATNTPELLINRTLTHKDVKIAVQLNAMSDRQTVVVSGALTDIAEQVAKYGSLPGPNAFVNRPKMQEPEQGQTLGGV